MVRELYEAAHRLNGISARNVSPAAGSVTTRIVRSCFGGSSNASAQVSCQQKVRSSPAISLVSSPRNVVGGPGCDDGPVDPLVGVGDGLVALSVGVATAVALGVALLGVRVGAATVGVGDAPIEPQPAVSAATVRVKTIQAFLFTLPFPFSKLDC